MCSGWGGRQGGAQGGREVSPPASLTKLPRITSANTVQGGEHQDPLKPSKPAETGYPRGVDVPPSPPAHAESSSTSPVAACSRSTVGVNAVTTAGTARTRNEGPRRPGRSHPVRPAGSEGLAVSAVTARVRDDGSRTGGEPTRHNTPAHPNRQEVRTGTTRKIRCPHGHGDRRAGCRPQKKKP
jgi:hypothetical protein